MKKNNKILIYVLSFVLSFSLLVIPSFAEESNSFVGSYTFNYVIDFSPIDLSLGENTIGIDFVYDNATYNAMTFINNDGYSKSLIFVDTGGDTLDVFNVSNDGSFSWYVSAPLTIDIISFDSSETQLVEFLTRNQLGGNVGEGLYFDLYDTLNGLIFGGNVPLWADIGLSFLALFVCLCCFVAPTAFILWGVKIILTSMRL